MNEAPAPAVLQQAFGLASLGTESLTPWATVLRGSTSDGQDVVVKLTADSADRAKAMAAWTSKLAGQELPVVSPVILDVANPQEVGDGWWVVYPYIEGRSYLGGEDDARAAGSLLGRVHAFELSPDVTGAMRQYEFPDTAYEDVESDLATLEGILPEELDAVAMSSVRALARRWWDTALPTLREEDEREPLPRAALSSDYRSTNIVYGDGTVTLIDPDNGGYEPRLFELAMAVVLFHREAATAPARMFSPAEWQAFYNGYSQHVALTERERRLWPLALDHMLWEEGTWVLEDTDANGWSDARERGYLAELAVAIPEDFPIPS